MQGFLEKIYAVENFGTYILVAIGVLVVAFIIILFLGKKDKKLEETKKLEALKKETFEEASKTIQEKVKEEQIVKVSKEQDKEKEETVKLEKEKEEEIRKEIDNPLEAKEEAPVEVFEFAPEVEPTKPLEEIKVETVKEEVKPKVEKAIEPKVKEEVKPILEKEEIDIPEFDFDDLASTLDKEDDSKEVFSSVFVPEEEEPKVIRIVTEEKTETEFDLPKLKEDDFTFDKIEGEEYNINK